MGRSGGQYFLVGGRYRNRRGEYEVLEIMGDKMRVRYDSGKEEVLDVHRQRVIAENMEIEAHSLAPYDPLTQDEQNERFFWSVGFLARRVKKPSTAS